MWKKRAENYRIFFFLLFIDTVRRCPYSYRGTLLEAYLKVGLFGFGRTGRVVAEEIINDSTCTLEWVVRKTDQSNHEYASDFLGYPRARQGQFFCAEETASADFFAVHPVDVIIDFSCKTGLYEYTGAADQGIRIVSAISHYDKKELLQLKEMA